jgi:hypothetical protein
MAKAMQMKNSDLQRMFGALKILGNRRMANLGADLKVARMLRLLAPLAEPLEAKKSANALALYQEEVPEGASLTPMQEQVLRLAIDASQRGVDDAMIDVALPIEFALKQADLPSAESGQDGWRNGAALGAVIADLGDLFTVDEAPTS